ncbi:MAG: ATP-dependent Clp protease proteolytic subunit [Parvularcula sp.]|jgi:ATP-dependent Clp protease protease subunit|nr:ATP-dependent Clp protease proteolytic subunit [Parvularcula sp.]
MNDLVRLDDDAEAVKDQKPGYVVDKHLFEARQVMIIGQVNMDLAKDVCQRLLAMATISNKPITVTVCSPGGHVEAGDMIHDTIRFISPKVNMIAMGWAASAGALIYVSVPKERRFCTPNTRFLLHQPSGGAGGMASDIEIQAREIIRMRDRLNRIFAEATGQTPEKIEQDTDRDHWMNPEEAIAYGLVGKVVNTVDDLN